MRQELASIMGYWENHSEQQRLAFIAGMGAMAHLEGRSSFSVPKRIYDEYLALVPPCWRWCHPDVSGENILVWVGKVAMCPEPIEQSDAGLAKEEQEWISNPPVGDELI